MGQTGYGSKVSSGIKTHPYEEGDVPLLEEEHPHDMHEDRLNGPSSIEELKMYPRNKLKHGVEL